MRLELGLAHSNISQSTFFGALRPLIAIRPRSLNSVAAMRDSPLPTPPLRAPNDRNERRFKEITSPCEWVEDYHPGGYHPVHLGNVFNNQYKVLRKLGEGSYSTVWLARDLKYVLPTLSSRYVCLFPSRQNIYVALKILVSEVSEPTRELQILRYIAESAEGTRHITKLLDEFKHHGPNGIHICLVFEPMGPSANSMVEALPQFNPPNIRMKIRYPPRMAKSILRQSLEALAFLHENGVAHGDFQPGNILFALDDINSKPEDVFQQEENTASPPVQRLDGKDDPWAPRYLYIAQPLVLFTPYIKGFKVKLSDMGGGKYLSISVNIAVLYLNPVTAYFFADPPAKPITPRGLRAPELVLAGTVNKTLDIWSFGCLLFELVTGRPLFCVPGSRFEDDDHLLALSIQLGPLPDALFRQWKGSSL